MSRFEGLISTNTELRLEDVYGWLNSLPNWEGQHEGNELSHRRICRTVDGAATAILIDVGNYRSGSSASSIKSLGSARTIVVDISVNRNGAIGCLDYMYEVAFEFCKLDLECSVWFTLDDENYGVFIRKRGVYSINPEEFYAASLAAFLPSEYRISENLIRDVEQTYRPVGEYTKPAEQCDAPKPE